jgi:predicted nucleic acid-binding protein
VGRVLTEAESIHAPALCDLEIASVFRRGMLTGDLTAERAGAALTDLLDLPIVRHTHELLLSRVLALRENFTAYDASYVALAEALDCPLLTTDQRLARAVVSLRIATLVELPD